MKSLRQLGFLKLNLRPDGSPEDDHRVLALFRNRAELKKAYGDLQEEIFRLKDLIKQQEAATQRVQDMLATLEGRLGTAETAYPALVFYQLRRLWQSGRELIASFIADLARQQEDRERLAHIAQHNRRQFARRQGAESRVRAAEGLHAEVAAQLTALEAERARLTRFWHYFKRRALERRIAAARAAVESAAASLGEARTALDQVGREGAPEFQGLSLTARRSINLAAIAYAEVLCLRLTQLKAPLLKLAREATARRETPDEYGSPKECVLLMGQIARAQRLIGERTGWAAEVRARGARLQAAARYRGEADTAPLADSLAFTEGDVLASPALGTQAERLPNVLAEDTWDLFRVLLR
jgi:hypothetical protein